MTLSPHEARDALNDVAAAEARTRMFRSYRISSPHLILWGVIWMIGYSVGGVASPKWINITWAILIALGFLGGIWFTRRAGAGNSAARRGLIWLPIVLFVISTYTLMQPTLKIQFEAFPALCTAAAYAFMGLFRAPAYLWLACLIYAIILIGYFFLQPIFPYLMALAGGGSLIASGIWLGRK